MIFTLCASSLKAVLAGKTPTRLGLNDLPAYTRDTLGLAGLRMTTDLLTGAGRNTLTGFRDACDRARCSCLVLHETTRQPLGELDAGEVAGERLKAVLHAGGLLGCTSVSFCIDATDDPDSFEVLVDRLKGTMDLAERLSINLLISPSAGLTSDAMRLTELIKRVGGFRLGTSPDFLEASQHDDPAGYLKRITPYAAAMVATTVGFETVPIDLTGEPIDLAAPNSEVAVAQAVAQIPPDHAGYAMTDMIEAIRAVGYDQTVAIRYQGEGDPRAGVLQSHAALLEAIAVLDGTSTSTADAEALLSAVLGDLGSMDDADDNDNDNDNDIDEDDGHGDRISADDVDADEIRDDEVDVEDSAQPDDPVSDEVTAAKAAKRPTKKAARKPASKTAKKTDTQPTGKTTAKTGPKAKPAAADPANEDG